MHECPQCGDRMSRNDETTKLTEYVCSRCHTTEIERKSAYRVTTPTGPGVANGSTVADD